MKKILISICLLICVLTGNAQNTFPANGSAGIGTNAPAASSLLEIKSTTKGMLIPRMTSSQRNAIASPATGLLIYQTNSTPGFYYYTGTAWTALKTTAGWGLKGNAGTNTGVNFIGTTDTASFILKTNNQLAGILSSNTTANTSYGYQALMSNANYNNTAVGYNTLKLNTTAGYNTAVGTYSMLNNTVGYQNTAVGSNSLQSNQSGNYNAAFGYGALLNNTTGSSNVAVGNTALLQNKTGNTNIAIGSDALNANTTGSSNIGVGSLALFSNTSGFNNISVGKSALQYNTTGQYNIAIGNSALRINNTDENTAIGFAALSENTSGTQNTATGAYALTQNDAGYANAAYGYGSLLFNTSGYSNSAFGFKSLYSNETGRDNTACGYQALLNSNGPNADGNSAFGSHALRSNTTGSGNCAMGYGCMSSNTTGLHNVAVGYGAFEYNTSGSANVAVGQRALNWNTTGQRNTAVGEGANTTTFIGTFNNITAIGNEAIVDASNKIRLGDNSVSSIGGQVGWTNFSDGRIKKEIKENVPGLIFINDLRPVTYHFDLNKENELTGISDNSSYPEKYDIEKIAFTGFIAQEVEASAKKINYDFSGVDKSGKIMGLRYAEFVVPVVKSIQELSQQNEDLKKENQEIKKENREIKAAIIDMQNQLDLMASNQKNALQNSAEIDMVISPNPAHYVANISITSSDKSKTYTLKIFDAVGRQINAYQVIGNTVFELNTSTLNPGTFLVQLFNKTEMILSQKLVIE
ncbi:MAG: tail fiber domain-containing protein [Bacteroidetes bacterium]|nr:tail fiber domain-containing protein [Bacteroidota bacterium]